MRLLRQSHEILNIHTGKFSGALSLIELAGRTCYQSKNSGGSPENFVKKITDNGHHSVLEHSAISVRFVTDRGVMAELTRHRLCAFSIESTRYCDYAGEKFTGNLTFVIPDGYSIPEGIFRSIAKPPDGLKDPERVWYMHMIACEHNYRAMRAYGESTEYARSVLPNSLKTEIIMTCNFREMLHILKLRCSPKAHPQMRALMTPLAERLHEYIPSIFS